MGTTQRIVPGVSGEPNWGDLNRAITNIAKAVEQQKKSHDNQNLNPDQVAKATKKNSDRRNGHVKAAFKNLVKTGGGAKTISSGKSKSIGRAGLKSSGRLVNFYTSVSSSGLQKALQDIGLGNLAGKSVQDITDFLLVYCVDNNSGMDETAASKATCEVLNEIATESNNDLDKYEELINSYVDSNGLADILCKFWGLYIYEHLSQRFEEKITQNKGTEVSKETFRTIKEDIMGQVKVLNETRSVAKIDWQGNEGTKNIESIFESIIKIICDDN